MKKIMIYIMFCGCLFSVSAKAQEIKSGDLKTARNAVYEWISDYNVYAKCVGRTAKSDFYSLFEDKTIEIYNDYFPMFDYDFNNQMISVENYFELVGDEGGVDEDTTVGDNEGNNEGNVEGDIEEGNNNGGSTEGDTENGENNENIEEGDTEEGDSNGDIDEGTNEEIIEEGTIENPIIVENPTAGMNYVVGKYYKYGEVIYLCIREGYLYHDPSTLVGNYFEIA